MILDYIKKLVKAKARIYVVKNLKWGNVKVKKFSSFVLLLIFFSNYFGVTYGDQRLINAETDDSNWLTYGNGYSNNRKVGLSQINQNNVDKLKPVWIYQTGVLGTFPNNPIVVDGDIFITTPRNHVISLDVETGEKNWRYEHELIEANLCCGTHNRGVAWSHNKLYMITADGRLVCLNASNGEIIWDVPMVDPMSNRASDLDSIRNFSETNKSLFDKLPIFPGNMAPVVYNRTVFVGVSGAGYSAVLKDAESKNIDELGKPGDRKSMRAFFSAYDAETGALKWRWYSTKSSGWEGAFSETTSFGEDLNRDIEKEKLLLKNKKDSWKRGGGSIYSSPSIDVENNLIFFGTGNPAPTYDEYERPGDNLYTSSLIALNLTSGELVWYFQLIPHDIWGYDVAAPPVLFTLTRDSLKVPAVAVASKTGRIFFFNRLTGKSLGRSDMFVPKYNTMFKKPTADGLIIAPGAAGGANWPPLAFDSNLQLLFVAGSHRPTVYTSYEHNGVKRNRLNFVSGKPEWGTLSAIEVATGLLKWQKKSTLPVVSGAVVTDGGLVFYGESDGRFLARRSSDGKLLWSFQTGAGVNAPPISFLHNNVQYVVVASGGHSLFGYAKGNALIAFALSK